MENNLIDKYSLSFSVYTYLCTQRFVLFWYFTHRLLLLC